jgi:hypothetical protein
MIVTAQNTQTNVSTEWIFEVDHVHPDMAALHRYLVGRHQGLRVDSRQQAEA